MNRQDGQSMDIVFRASWDDPKSTVTIRPSVASSIETGEMLPSRELTYPFPKALLKKSFLFRSPGGICDRSLEASWVGSKICEIFIGKFYLTVFENKFFNFNLQTGKWFAKLRGFLDLSTPVLKGFLPALNCLSQSLGSIWGPIRWGRLGGYKML